MWVCGNLKWNIEIKRRKIYNKMHHLPDKKNNKIKIQYLKLFIIKFVYIKLFI